MNVEIQEIIDKFSSFNNYLYSINLQDWKSKFSENKLREFEAILNTLQLNLISLEDITKGTVTEQKSEENPPEVIYSNHFPIVKQADFLTEKEQRVLDNYLWILRKGETISRLPRLTDTIKEKLVPLEQFLIDKQIAKPYYLVVCPFCKEGYLSKPLTETEKESLEQILLNTSNSEERFQLLSEILIYSCMKCEEQLDIDTVQSLKYKPILKMIGVQTKQNKNVIKDKCG